MKPVICIPSYKRPQGTAIYRLRDIPLSKYLFVRLEEESIYKEVAAENGFRLVKLNNVHDIGETRAAIMRFCYSKHFEWVFMFDDDIQKVECLAQKDGKITSARILYEPEEKPRFELKALKLWYDTARRYKLSLSSPNHRAYDRFKHGTVQINKSAIIQCVLIHTPDLWSVGNYKSLNKVGNEDYYVQYLLMNNGYKTGKIGSIEYDCPCIGAGSGGNNAEEYKDIKNRYEFYVNNFLNNVCNDPQLVTTKTTKTGQKSIQFIWKNWGGSEHKEDL